jgi:hypothetical protein
MIEQTQIRLLVLSSLLLCTTVIREADRHTLVADTSVFSQPPAYLHAPAALGFDLSGLSAPARDRTEAALLESAQSALDVETRAHAHLSLANYYKMRGLTEQATIEKRKGEYWRRIAKHVPEDQSL